jgi:hypothetical protein
MVAERGEFRVGDLEPSQSRRSLIELWNRRLPGYTGQAGEEKTA